MWCARWWLFCLCPKVLTLYFIVHVPWTQPFWLHCWSSLFRTAAWKPVFGKSSYSSIWLIDWWQPWPLNGRRSWRSSTSPNSDSSMPCFNKRCKQTKLWIQISPVCVVSTSHTSKHIYRGKRPDSKMSQHIMQTTFSHPFSWIKSFLCLFKFKWSLFLRVQLSKNRRQPITWTKIGIVHRRICAALGGDALIEVCSQDSNLQQNSIDSGNAI